MRCVNMKLSESKLFLSGITGCVVFLLLAAISVTSFVSNYNYGNRAEQTIVSEYENMENILAQYSLKISEAAQIPSMQTDDLVKIFSNTLPARYGENGSQAAFQWLQEQNPQLNQETYLKLQTLIEAGRNKFENAQTKFIDTKRVYNTNLGYLWKGFWLSVAGYPRIDLDDFNIISSDHAKSTFESGVDTGLKLR